MISFAATELAKLSAPSVSTAKSGTRDHPTSCIPSTTPDNRPPPPTARTTKSGVVFSCSFDSRIMLACPSLCRKVFMRSVIPVIHLVGNKCHRNCEVSGLGHRAQIFKIFEKVSVKLFHIFCELNTLKGNLSNLLEICRVVPIFDISIVFKRRHFDYFCKRSSKILEKKKIIVNLKVLEESWYNFQGHHSLWRSTIWLQSKICSSSG